MNLKLLSIFVFSLLCYNYCHAQTGYKYPRPEGSIGTNENILTSAGASPIRPVVGFPSSTPTPGFGIAPSFQSSGLTPTPAYGFQSATRPAGASFGISGSNTANQFSSAPSFQTATGTIGVNRQIGPSRSGSVYQPTSTGTGIGRQTVNNVDGTYEGDYSAIPGEPGVDYPIFSETPQTNFDCSQQQYPGYYADVEARCQVFHICALNRTYSFLCPNGTIFSQATLVCVWWNQYDCGSAPVLYPNNAFIYDYTQTGDRSSTNLYTGNTQPGAVTSRPSATQSFGGAGRTPPNAPLFSAAIRPTQSNVKFPTAGSQQGSISSFTNSGSATGSGFNLASGYSGTQPSGFPMATGITGPSSIPNNFATSEIRPGFGTTVRPGFVSNPSFPISQVYPTTSTREYLPPQQA